MQLVPMQLVLPELRLLQLTLRPLRRRPLLQAPQEQQLILHRALLHQERRQIANARTGGKKAEIPTVSAAKGQAPRLLVPLQLP
jgi:hypothetical protein